MSKVLWVRTTAIVTAVALMTVAIATMAGGCGSRAEEGKEKTVKTTDETGGTKEETTVTDTAGGLSRPEMPSPEEIVAMGSMTAVLETNKGRIVLSFYPQDAPVTVANFIQLTKAGFYDGIKFHRYEPGFVIQGGDPLSKDDDPSNDGTGGPGYTVPAEFNPRPHLEGTVAMARSDDPHSAGSQFYICLAPAPFLDGAYTVFGEVREGMNVVLSLRAGDVMERVTIVEN